jgi:hypothetical protein
MIADKILGYYWIDGKANPANTVSKHWGYQQICHLLRAVLFYSSYTNDLVGSEHNKKSKVKGTLVAKEENPRIKLVTL